MSNQIVALTLAFILFAEPSFAAAEPAIQEVDWGRFQQINSKRVQSRSAAIRLADGGTVTAVVLEIRDEGLAVQPGRATRQFKETNGRALVPRDAIQSVQFKGRTGRKGMWGLLVGAGAGAATAAGVAAGCNGGQCEGAAAGIMAVCVAAGLVVGGWAIGHAADAKFPEYRIVGK